MSASACKRTRSETKEESGLAAAEIYVSLNQGGTSASGKQQGNWEEMVWIAALLPALALPPFLMVLKHVKSLNEYL